MKGDCMSDEEAERMGELRETTEMINDRPQVTRAWPVKFLKIHPDAKIPERGTADSAGYDLFCVEDVRVSPGEIAKIPLGFSTEIHPDIHGRIESRSGLALKGMVVLTGVIDSDYRGEWNVILKNMNTLWGVAHQFAKGDKVAQVVFRPTVPVQFEAVSELSDTSRGAGGFGSTGR